MTLRKSSSGLWLPTQADPGSLGDGQLWWTGDVLRGYDGSDVVDVGPVKGNWPRPDLLSGALSWTQDPSLCFTVLTQQATGKLWVARMPWARRATVTNIVYRTTTAGSGLTAGQNLLALYTSAGALIANSTTPDQTTNFQATAGNFTATLSSPPVVPPDPNGYIYAAILSNGTTRPVFVGPGGAAATVNMGIASGVAQRAGLIASTFTAMPSTITLTTMAVAPVPVVVLF